MTTQEFVDKFNENTGMKLKPHQIHYFDRKGIIKVKRDENGYRVFDYRKVSNSIEQYYFSKLGVNICQSNNL